MNAIVAGAGVAPNPLKGAFNSLLARDVRRCCCSIIIRGVAVARVGQTHGFAPTVVSLASLVQRVQMSYYQEAFAMPERLGFAATEH